MGCHGGGSGSGVNRGAGTDNYVDSTKLTIHYRESKVIGRNNSNLRKS